MTASFKVRVLLSVTASGTLITILLYPLPPKVLIVIPAKCCCPSPGCSFLLSKLLVTLVGAAFLQFSSGHFSF